FHAPKIVGVQEALQNQVQDIKTSLPGFTYVGVGRDDGKTAGEYSPVFYDSTYFEIINGGTFWLSETPREVSKGWDAALPRVCSFVELKDPSGNSFVVYNAHFDHIGVEARRQSAKLIMDHYEKFNSGKPVVFMGDLNFTDDDPAYVTITEEGFRDTRKLASPYGPKATFNGFNWETEPERRIDYIFINGSFMVNMFAVLTDSRYNRYPSDHFPVIVSLQLR
ncbi:MAG: endonuclease/exonuclease/phosphatase family protein, partial [Cyclobacteriaceae bacterium]